MSTSRCNKVATPWLPDSGEPLETFGIRDGKIHEVEVFLFVTLPYGLGNGWTIGLGR